MGVIYKVFEWLLICCFFLWMAFSFMDTSFINLLKNGTRKNGSKLLGATRQEVLEMINQVDKKEQEKLIKDLKYRKTGRFFALFFLFFYYRIS